jgi:hypothetical protein
MSDYKESEFYIECHCGCGTLQIVNSRDKEDVFLNYLIPAFYSNQDGILSIMKKRLSILWKVVVLGKEYLLYDIVIADHKKLQEFKNYVASLEIKNDRE